MALTSSRPLWFLVAVSIIVLLSWLSTPASAVPTREEPQGVWAPPAGPAGRPGVGDNWTLVGQFEQEEQGTVWAADLASAPVGAIVNVSVRAPLRWIWQTGSGQAVDMSLTLFELTNPELSEFRVDDITCYLSYYDSEEDEWALVATSGPVHVGKHLTEEPLVIEDIQVKFTRDFMWEELFKHVCPLDAYMIFNIRYTAFFTPEGQEEGELSVPLAWVSCVPPGYDTRAYTLSLMLTELNPESGAAKADIVEHWLLGEKDVEFHSSWPFNAKKPSYDFLEGLIDYWCLLYEETPGLLLSLGPLLLTDDWGATGDEWVSYVSSFASENDVDMTGSFRFEDAVVANREVHLAVLELSYNVDISEGGPGGLREATGTYHVAWGFDNETGALMRLTWEEDITFTNQWTGGSSYREERHRTLSFTMSIREASFEFGEPIGPMLFLKSARTSSKWVLEGGTLTLTVEVGNKGEVVAHGVRVRWESPGFTGEEEKTIDVPAGGSAEASFELRAAGSGNTTIEVSVYHMEHLVARQVLHVYIGKAINPSPVAMAAAVGGAVAGAVGAGISAVSAGVSATPAAAAGAPSPVTPTGPEEAAKPSFLSKILSGIRYLLGRQKKKKLYEPPKNSLGFLLGLVILAAICATASLLLAGARLDMASIPISIYLSAIGFALACSSLSLFARRVIFYHEYGLKVGKRETAYLALSLGLGLWGVISSPLGLLAILVAYLASIPLAIPALLVLLHAIADVRSWL